MKKKLAVIVLNWNNFSDTAECIESVINSDRSVDIYLIDNGSGPADIEALKDISNANKQIHLVLNHENLGFAKAHNKIFELLAEKYEYFFLLNNDAVIDKKLFSILEKEISKSNPDMISCRMVNYYKHQLMDNAGHLMLSSGEILPLGHGENVRKFNKSFINMGPCAGAGLYSTRMLHDIGFFDEYFVTGYEDAELGLRATVAGYRSVYQPSAVVYHKMSRTIARVFDFDFALKTQCNIYYTTLKLVHWQVLMINFIPWLLKLMFILLFSLLFLRFKVLRVQFSALCHLLFNEMDRILKARKKSKKYIRISWIKMFSMQKCFIFHDLKTFFQIVFLRRKSYFENY